MVVIRAARMEDLDALAHLFDLYRIFYGKASDVEEAKKFLSQRIRDKESVIYVADDEKNLLGFTQLYPQFSSTRMKRSWLLNDLFVLKEHRQRGISKLLIERAKNLALKTGAAGILLETDKSNQVGNRLYLSKGFVLNDKSNFYWWEYTQ
ncbi:MAG TPA: GNAT family N-acetyltransferase [Puia sp.]|jgi:GNAT superfamily N-acetyltransferase|nr:GNAT family N-acetyltransferase [Puia sp.]